LENAVRDEKGRIRPGHTLNPGGRPKGFAQKCRDATDDGNDLVATAQKFARGEIPGQSTRDQLEAIKFLTAYGWGKAPETNVNIEVASTEESAQTAADMARDLLVTNGVKHG
jgi:hypothetical protein